MLAAARQAVLVPTVPSFYQPLRRQIDAQENVEARMCFYLSALFTAIEDVQHYLSTGIPVVVESYLARCLVNHQAFGTRLDVMLPLDLPQPVTYQLVCAEDERQRRLAQRNKPTSRWDELGESLTDRITAAYAQFPMHRVDTTGLEPEQVVNAILVTGTQGAPCRADTESLGTHAHVLPAVPGAAEGARCS
ncbi:hypothetical protein [Dactylosporangium sp. NPDC051484]|uniref:hypothetical protein n=1 Tax=Dactylosporangium sp. NPDC051484 TaxID=3154942 RepID=UPI00344E165B